MLPLLLGTGVFILLAAGTFVPLENWFPRAEAPPRPRAIAVCVGLFAVNTLCMGLLGPPALAAFDAVSTRVHELPTCARLSAALVLGDVLAYGLHRAMHRVPLLWRLHRLHHAPTQLRFWEGWRVHPVDFVAHGLALGIPGVLLGASIADFVGLVLLRKAFTLYLHANLAWRHGPLAWLLASPSWHALHHDADRRGQDANFAGTFPFVDMVFGTHRAP